MGLDKVRLTGTETAANKLGLIPPTNLSEPESVMIDGVLDFYQKTFGQSSQKILLDQCCFIELCRQIPRKFGQHGMQIILDCIN